MYNFIINFIITFFLYGKKWQFHYTTTPFAFKAMTKFCERKLNKCTYDVIFQTQTLFAASFNKPEKPYYVHVDYTHRFSQKFCEVWAGNRKRWQLKKWGKLEEDMLNNADSVFTFNDEAKKIMERRYNLNLKKIKVAGVGVNLREVSEINKKYDFKTIMIVTRKSSRKLLGLDTLLKAFKIVNIEFPQTNLWVVGYKLKSDPRNVQSFDLLPLKDIIKFYEKASIFVMPGIMGGPQATLEAMSKKCICIGGRENIMLKGIIIDGVTGYEIESYNVNDLAEKIKFIIKNKPTKLGRESYKNMLKHFTWPRVAENIRNEIQKNLTSVS